MSSVMRRTRRTRGARLGDEFSIGGMSWAATMPRWDA
jgi:hypothetical protein